MEAKTIHSSPLGKWRLRQNDVPTYNPTRRPAPLQTEISKRFSFIKAQPTPPDTPQSSPAFTSEIDDSAIFHNYLRAFCHFEPPSAADAQDEAMLMTARIRPGDLILIHSVHANGWADGTVLSTNTRGWLPTNYCEKFSHPYLGNLLNAMTQFWDLLGASEDGNLATFIRQDYIRPLIAGVRYLLEHADCLHRDSALVQRSAGIRRLRKGLLGDLSTLVQIGRKLQEVITEPFAADVIHVLLDDLMTKACKIVTRAVVLSDLLAQEVTELSPLRALKRLSGEYKAAESAEGSSTGGADASQGTSHQIDSAKHFPTPTSTTREAKTETSQPQFPRRSARPRSGVISHRLSTTKKEHPQSRNLASVLLANAHDLCISHIGGFIGLLLHASSPASELLAITHRLSTACEIMLEVADKIAEFEPQHGHTIRHARRNFQSKLDELKAATEDLVSSADRPEGNVILIPERANHLVNLGTDLIRTVGDCVVKTRKVIEQIGDFDLENPTSEEGDVNKECQTFPGATYEDGACIRERPASRGASTTSGTSLSAGPNKRRRAKTTTDATDFAQPPSTTSNVTTPRSVLPPTPRISLVPSLDADGPATKASVLLSDTSKFSRTSRPPSTSPARKCSVGASISASTDTRQSSMRDSGITAVSEVSTRATTPDHSKEGHMQDSALFNSIESLSSLPSAVGTDASIDAETDLLQKTYANELTLNREGQVTGGSLPALVEQMTAGDAAPDPHFVAAFFVTFRSFTSPRELAQALTNRFDYIGDTQTTGTPVRLRIYNVFKGWLETYWNTDLDKEALGDVRYFALHKLKPIMPIIGERLLESIRRVNTLYQNVVPAEYQASIVSKMSSTTIGGGDVDRDTPESNVTKSQLNALRKAVAESSATSSIIDFDPLELARQMTVLASTVFCRIQPTELLSLEWNKKDSSKADNVRHMCVLNTDVAHVVGDTILTPEDAKKRALVIKHWSKVAIHCLALNNYESLMAIMCSLNSSVVQRLKRTWEVVSKKTKARLEELNTVVDFSRNQTSLRRRLENATTPCLPFLGIYLTDLTMVDAGNPKLREIPNTDSASGETLSVINFDKHMRMAKIVSNLQHFQVAYKLKEVPEMQAWMGMHLERMRGRHAQMVGDFHRRSLHIEPKRDPSGINAPPVPKMPELQRPQTSAGNQATDERPKTAGTIAPTIKSFKPRGQTFEFLMKANFTFKSQPSQTLEVPALTGEMGEK